MADQETDQGGFVANLVFVPRGTDAVFAGPYHSATRNFNTFLWYEVISPVDNFHYSTTYLFSYGPFSHTGLKVDYAMSNDQSLILAIMNPTDFTEMNDFYTYGLQYWQKYLLQRTLR